MAIANGRRLNPLQAVAEGARCTWFLAAVEPRTARKRWIAGSLKPVGRLRVDAGALKALKEGKSLLPAGVTAVEGRFERGDARSEEHTCELKSLMRSSYAVLRYKKN